MHRRMSSLKEELKIVYLYVFLYSIDRAPHSRVDCTLEYMPVIIRQPCITYPLAFPFVIYKALRKLFSLLFDKLLTKEKSDSSSNFAEFTS